MPIISGLRGSEIKKSISDHWQVRDYIYVTGLRTLSSGPQLGILVPPHCVHHPSGLSLKINSSKKLSLTL